MKTAYVVINRSRARIFIDKKQLAGHFETISPEEREALPEWRRFVAEDTAATLSVLNPGLINRVAVLEVLRGGRHKPSVKPGLKTA